MAGFLFGLPALRLEGLYLALATLDLAVATPQILKFKGFDSRTGGVQGIQVDSPAAPFGLPLNTDRWTYYFCLIWTIALFTVARNLLRGRTGRAIIAIRDHPQAAATMGIDTAVYKSLTFGVSYLFPEGGRGRASALSQCGFGVSRSLKTPPWNYLAIRRRRAKDFAGGALNESQGAARVGKEVVGIHILLIASLFDGSILRRLLLRASYLPPGAKFEMT